MDVKPLHTREKDFVIQMVRDVVRATARELSIRRGYEDESIERNKITELAYIALSEYLHV